MASSKTVVKGIRAEKSFFEMCDSQARAENIDRNKLIVKVVSEYIEMFNNTGLKPKIIILDDLNTKNTVARNKKLEMDWENHKKQMENQNGNT